MSATLRTARLPLPAARRHTRARSRLQGVAAVVLAVGFAVGVLAVSRALVDDGPRSLPNMTGQVDPKRPALPVDFTHDPIRSETSLAATHARGLVSMPWGLSRIDDAARSIEIYFAAGNTGCVSLRGMYVIETAARVSIAVLSQSSGDSACAADLKTGRARITLARPLANRVLTHAVVDRRWRTVLPRG